MDKELSTIDTSTKKYLILSIIAVVAYFLFGFVYVFDSGRKKASSYQTTTGADLYLISALFAPFWPLFIYGNIVTYGFENAWSGNPNPASRID